MSKYMCLVAMVLATSCLARISQAQQLQSQYSPEAAGNIQTNTVAAEQPAASRGIWPLVNVDRAENKSKVDVNIPLFFNMNNERDTNEDRHKLDLSVLSGLVTVNKDRSRLPDGQVSGPLIVTVFGIPVYTSPGYKPASSAELDAVLRERQRVVENMVETTQGSVADKIDSTANKITSVVQATNERALRSLSDLAGNLSKRIRASASHQPDVAMPGARVNGLQAVDNQVPAVATPMGGDQIASLPPQVAANAV